ncbi:hypothetical protein DL96DRAFT_1823388 [Flagelloscypha sp. PMI_526]|nr:hypothetical protein DL96DRAFT_1823388 [Flagelloscypha sp. PMI_526]
MSSPLEILAAAATWNKVAPLDAAFLTTATIATDVEDRLSDDDLPHLSQLHLVPHTNNATKSLNSKISSAFAAENNGSSDHGRTRRQREKKRAKKPAKDNTTSTTADPKILLFTCKHGEKGAKQKERLKKSGVTGTAETFGKRLDDMLSYQRDPDSTAAAAFKAALDKTPTYQNSFGAVLDALYEAQEIDETLTEEKRDKPAKAYKEGGQAIRLHALARASQHPTPQTQKLSAPPSRTISVDSPTSQTTPSTPPKKKTAHIDLTLSSPVQPSSSTKENLPVAPAIKKEEDDISMLISSIPRSPASLEKAHAADKEHGDNGSLAEKPRSSKRTKRQSELEKFTE